MIILCKHTIAPISCQLHPVKNITRRRGSTNYGHNFFVMFGGGEKGTFLMSLVFFRSADFVLSSADFIARSTDFNRTSSAPISSQDFILSSTDPTTGSADFVILPRVHQNGPYRKKLQQELSCWSFYYYLFKNRLSASTI